jgi:DNA-binding transcriptional LysR family regulator
MHILLAVVQHGSMARAAAALAISQPAVSKALIREARARLRSVTNQLFAFSASEIRTIVR